MASPRQYERRPQPPTLPSQHAQQANSSTTSAVAPRASLDQSAPIDVLAARRARTRQMYQATLKNKTFVRDFLGLDETDNREATVAGTSAASTAAAMRSAPPHQNRRATRQAADSHAPYVYTDGAKSLPSGNQRTATPRLQVQLTEPDAPAARSSSPSATQVLTDASAAPEWFSASSTPMSPSSDSPSSLASSSAAPPPSTLGWQPITFQSMAPLHQAVRKGQAHSTPSSCPLSLHQTTPVSLLCTPSASPGASGHADLPCKAPQSAEEWPGCPQGPWPALTPPRSRFCLILLNKYSNQHTSVIGMVQWGWVG